LRKKGFAGQTGLQPFRKLLRENFKGFHLQSAVDSYQGHREQAEGAAAGGR
jgi:hypothetical protein